MFAMKTTACVILVLVASLIGLAQAGPFGYGICQTGCNTVWVSCVSAGGGVAGVSTGGPGVPAAILGCNSANGVCMASCVAAGLTPVWILVNRSWVSDCRYKICQLFDTNMVSKNDTRHDMEKWLLGSECYTLFLTPYSSWKSWLTIPVITYQTSANENHDNKVTPSTSSL